MIVNIAFQPENLKPKDEAFPAFQAGGLTLKVWALYKKHYVTSQHFRQSLVALAEYCERMSDPKDTEVPPYANVDEFVSMMGSMNFYGGVTGPRLGDFRAWVIAYWDYFNPNIQRKVTIRYKVKVMQEIDKELRA